MAFVKMLRYSLQLLSKLVEYGLYRIKDYETKYYRQRNKMRDVNRMICFTPAKAKKQGGMFE